MDTQYLEPNQCRLHDRTPYEAKLSGVITEIFESGVQDLPGLITELNERGVLAPDGNPWTEESFRTEMRELGA